MQQLRYDGVTTPFGGMHTVGSSHHFVRLRALDDANHWPVE